MKKFSKINEISYFDNNINVNITDNIFKKINDIK